MNNSILLAILQQQQNYISGDITKMIAGVYGGRLYYYNGSSWSEQQPAGNANKNWYGVGISGDKMIAGVNGGRLYYYNGSSWSEQQPAGNADKYWYDVGIS
jgi:phage shock protein PspC (stress-responsive transcriptional regulator)